MGFGTFLRAVGAQITPGGGTYRSTYDAEEEKRRRAQQVLQGSRAAQALQPVLNQPRIRVGTARNQQLNVEKPPEQGLRIRVTDALGQPAPNVPIDEARKQRALAAAQQSFAEADKYKQGASFFGKLKTVPGTLAESTRDVAVGGFRGIARVPETVARSVAQPIVGQDYASQKGPQTNPVSRFLYGSEPIQTYQERQQGYKQVLEGSRFKDYAGPLSAIGIAGMAASDIVPLPGKKVAQASIKELAKASTPQAVRNIVGKELSDDAVQALAGSNSPDLIKAVIDVETKRIKGLDVDASLNLDDAVSDETAKALSDAGLTRIKRDEISTDAEYKAGTISMKGRPEGDVNELLSHELGHHLWETKVTPEDRMAFEKLNPSATAREVSAKERGASYPLESESFSDYVAANLRGKPELVPAEVKGIVDKYAAAIKAEAKAAGIPPQQLAKKIENGAVAPVRTGSTVPSNQPSNFIQGDDLSSRLAQQAQEVKETYKPRGIKGKAKAAWDPRYRAVELDRRFAKNQGKRVNDIGASEKLDSALEASQQAKHIAYEYLKDSDVGKVIGKYGSKGQSSNDFNTYRIFKRDLEQRQAGRPAINKNISDTEIDSWVKGYEARNPGAENDLRMLVKDIEAVQDLAVKSDGRFLSPAELQAARTKPNGGRFEFFTPVQRAVAEELERPSIGVDNTGTLGRQKVLQEFTGSDIPIDPTFDSITDYVETIYRQLGQSRAANLYAKRTAEGLTGAKVVRTGDESARLQQLQGAFRELGDIQKTLGYQKLKISFKASAARKEAVNAQKAASNRARELLRQTVEDVDARAVIPKLSDEDLTDILKVANEPDIRNTPNVQRIYRKLIAKSEAHRRLVEKLQDVKMDMESVQAARKGLSSEMVDLRVDTRGQQIIAGLDENGNTFKIEVPPEDAIMLQGLDKEKINGALKAIHAAQTPFRQVFTGILNPGFQIAQATFNAVMAPFVSRRGIKVYSPDSIIAAVKSLSGRDEFTQAIRKEGAIRYGGGFEQLTKDSTADALASRGSAGAMAKWYAHPKRGWRAFESVGGKLDQMARTSASRAEYRAAKKAGLPEDEAIQSARYAYNNVLPNFRNLSSLVRGIDHAVIYAGASQAGTRTLLRSFKNDPIRQAARLGVVGAGITGVAAYNISQDAGKEFYDDMRKSGRGYILDNNVPVVLPGASKDKETGKWDGVYLVPIPPEMRPLNRSIQKAVYDGKEGVPVKDFGLAMFDFVTGQSRTLSNPAVQLGASLTTGKDVHTGQQITDETMLPEEKLKARGEFTLNSLGVVGQSIAGGGPERFIGSVQNRFMNPKGLSEGGEFYKNQADIIKRVGLNTNELNAYRGSVAPTGKDLADNDIKNKTYYDSSNKATTWLRYPKTFEVSKQLDAENRRQGDPGDPLFDLPADRLKIVLNQMANYSPGNYEEKAVLKLNPWLKEFNDQRSAFFDKINDQNKQRLQQLESRPDAKTNESITKKINSLKTSAANAGVDPAGFTIPKADEMLKAKLDEYGKIKDGKVKHQYTVDNPEVADFFTAQNDYKRAKRNFLGLPQFDNYPTPAPEIQKIMDEYSKLPKGNGPPKRDGTPSSPDRSAWIKSHPKEWEAIGSAFDKIAAWNAADEGAYAVYEGLNAEGNPDGTALTQSGGGSGGGLNFNGFGNRQGSAAPNVDISNFIGKGEPFGDTPKVRLRNVKTVKLPSATRGKKINISSLVLPTKAPTFGGKVKRG